MKCLRLGITKLMGSGCRYQRIDIYLYGNEKVVILRPVGDETPMNLVLFCNKVPYMLLL